MIRADPPVNESYLLLNNVKEKFVGGMSARVAAGIGVYGSRRRPLGAPARWSGERERLFDGKLRAGVNETVFCYRVPVGTESPFRPRGRNADFPRIRGIP